MKYKFFIIVLFIVVFSIPVRAERTLSDYIYYLDQAYQKRDPYKMEYNWKKICEIDIEYCNENYNDYAMMLQETQQRAYERRQQASLYLQRFAQNQQIIEQQRMQKEALSIQRATLELQRQQMYMQNNPVYNRPKSWNVYYGNSSTPSIRIKESMY